MSLISTRNIVAPLTNKVHLTAIVLGAIAFAVLRLSGGSIKAVRNTSTAVAPRTGVTQAQPAFAPQAVTRQPAAAAQQADFPKPNIVIGNQATRGTVPAPWERQAAPVEKKPAPVAKKPADGGGLNDIENLLGLN